MCVGGVIVASLQCSPHLTTTCSNVSRASTISAHSFCIITSLCNIHRRHDRMVDHHRSRCPYDLAALKKFYPCSLSVTHVQPAPTDASFPFERLATELQFVTLGLVMPKHGICPLPCLVWTSMREIPHLPHTSGYGAAGGPSRGPALAAPESRGLRQTSTQQGSGNGGGSHSNDDPVDTEAMHLHQDGSKGEFVGSY